MTSKIVHSTVKSLGVPAHIPVALGRVKFLSQQERIACELAAGGMPNVYIGRQMLLTEATVKIHMKNAFRKLGLSCRTELPMLFEVLVKAGFDQKLDSDLDVVAKLVAIGYTDVKIADLLGVGDSLVKARVRVLHRVAGVNNRTEFAARWWAAHPLPHRRHPITHTAEGYRWTPHALGILKDRVEQRVPVSYIQREMGLRDADMVDGLARLIAMLEGVQSTAHLADAEGAREERA